MIRGVKPSETWGTNPSSPSMSPLTERASEFRQTLLGVHSRRRSPRNTPRRDTDALHSTTEGYA